MKVEVKNIYKKFNTLMAVNNISFNIEKNKTMGLLGPNGCGKTTSIGMLLGLITPTSGQIFIDGTSLVPKNRIKLLSLMNFASPYIELPKKLTVKQNLEVYARLYGVVEIVPLDFVGDPHTASAFRRWYSISNRDVDDNSGQIELKFYRIVR